jgi:hypothetical protein
VGLVGGISWAPASAPGTTEAVTAGREWVSLAVIPSRTMLTHEGAASESGDLAGCTW